MPRFFTTTDKEYTLANVKFKAPEIKPSGSGHIDILNDFAWKNSVSRGSTSEVPSLHLNEFSLPYGKWMQNIANAFTNVANSSSSQKPIDPYAFLYQGIPTGFTYTLPHLITPGSTLKGAIQNSWEKINLLESFSKLPGFKTIGGFASGLEKTVEDFMGGYGYEQMQSFKSSSPRKVTISFPLYNTVDIKHTIDNFWFVHLFALQNLKIRTTFLTYIPPKVYEITPWGVGGVYMPVAVVTNYNVYSIGATREIGIESNDWKYVVPEAYKVEITFTDLIDPSTNIELGSTDGNRRVNVINRISGDIAGVGGFSNLAKKAVDALNFAQNAGEDILNK